MRYKSPVSSIWPSVAFPRRTRIDFCSLSCKLMAHRRALFEAWLRRSAHRLKPATDVHLGVSFTAVMPSSGRVGGFRIPAVHSKLGIPTSNHKPVDRTDGDQSTDFTSKFLQRCHAFRSVNQRFVIFTPRSRPVAHLVSGLSVRRLVPSLPCHAGGRGPSSKPQE